MAGSVGAGPLRWSLLAVFIGAVFVARRRAVAARRLAVQLEEARVGLRREQLDLRLQMLQAQIEPHFLFNTLANLRRLYRTRPAAGADMIDRLLHDLRAALPQMRDRHATLGDEIELVRAYLGLVQIWMGARLRYTFDVEPALGRLPFPPMLLATLVENAIRHGLEPTPEGGTVEVRAAAGTDDRLSLQVRDDGVGFGRALTGGTGVGLVNIRRQLALRFGDAGTLTIAERQPRGVVCTLRLSDHHRKSVIDGKALGTSIGAYAATTVLKPAP